MVVFILVVVTIASYKTKNLNQTAICMQITYVQTTTMMMMMMMIMCRRLNMEGLPTYQCLNAHLNNSPNGGLLRCISVSVMLRAGLQVLHAII